MSKSLETFQPKFGEAKAEWENPEISEQLLPFLFYVYALDNSRIRIILSDFHSNTWERVRTIQHLEDMRDVVGVGGSWSDFVDYLIESLSSDNVKLVLGGLLKSTSNSGATYAKLVAHKSKGMPLISLSLDKLVNSSANDAMAYLSLELFKAFKSKHNDVVEEQKRSCQLTARLAAEQEKNESLQNKLNTSAYSSKRTLSTFPISGAVDGPDTISVAEMPTAHDHQSIKGGKRAVPAYRRVKVRGAFLQDTEDTDDN
ncbi:U2 small nuclear ribonucleoprotein auxiliary factor-like protein [Tasmannia lanceolata]|uniref:U2 small nuclear ribonucleoprotein auxiliary factor-like protein n=1 Tax=Tasmannia lanceolata TaxID=3420 RepID=UPI0040640A71